MLKPIATELRAGQIIELGRVMPGETVFFTIDRKHALGTWTSATVDEELLLGKLIVSAIRTEEKSIVFTIEIPARICR